jgi:hypothetical protein
MKNCCVQTGEEFFRSKYPFAWSAEEDELTKNLLVLCKKWGKITNLVKDQFFIRTTSSLKLGANAITGGLRCSGCNGDIDYIFIGSRLFYFMWRINMICATYWTTQDQSKGNLLHYVGGSSRWPGKEQLEQVRIAYDMYFGDEPFLSAEGFKELKEQVSKLKTEPAVTYDYIGDFAKLFTLMHEIQHHFPLAKIGPKPIGIKISLPKDLEISVRRSKMWIDELNCDANSLYKLFLSSFTVFNEKFRMNKEQAKAQAASLVCAGADTALHSLQCLEEQHYGKVGIRDAAKGHDFITHPPSGLRRNSLGQSSYFLVTGKKIDALLRNEFTESWKMVAENVAGNMKVRDMLLNEYQKWRNTKS